MKKIINLILLIALMLSMVGCQEKKTNSKELPQTISQADWDSYRQEIELSTGLTMSYVEMGNPDGEIMILQHGTTDNSRIWSLAAPYLCEAGYHLYLIDMRGQGYSSKPDGFYTITDFACDIKAFMDEKNIDKAIMVGQSLGSIDMQAFMMMFPEKCEKVVLVASGCVDEIYTAGINAGYAHFMNLGDDDHMSDEFMDSWYACEVEIDEEFMTYLKKESQQLPGKVWKNLFGGCALESFKDMYQYFDSSIDTLIMYGTNDKMFDEGHQTRLREALPFADYIEYENVGHNIHIEIPERFAKDLIEWLNK